MCIGCGTFWNSLSSQFIFQVTQPKHVSHKAPHATTSVQQVEPSNNIILDTLYVSSKDTDTTSYPSVLTTICGTTCSKHITDSDYTT